MGHLWAPTGCRSPDKLLRMEHPGGPQPAACPPALSTDLEVGLLMPCKVIHCEESGGSVVTILDQLHVLGVLNTPDLDSVALVARDRLQRVVGALGE